MALLMKELVISRLVRKVEDLEFSPAISHAYGYVNNFLEPAISSLISKNDAEDLKFYVYLPKDLEELSDRHIERIKSEIKSKEFDIDEIKLVQKEGRR